MASQRKKLFNLAIQDIPKSIAQKLSYPERPGLIEGYSLLFEINPGGSKNKAKEEALFCIEKQ
ncbi:hypothetical protein DB42_EA00980 [Neochlamydia sp. EPS4]|nr:hypothetical protein DB42_EA00980 [Neochlamydia sp. EPS4]